MKYLFLVLSLALLGCNGVSEVTKPMRHMKKCHYNFFAPKAEAKYYDLIRQGYAHKYARDSTIHWTGILQLNVSYEYLNECACMPWNCEEYFQKNPDNHTRKNWDNIP